MKYFITGICGFVGSNLANELHRRGYKVAGCDTLQFGLAENISDNIFHTTDDFAELIYAYINSFDVLIHCATSNIIFAQQNCLETFNNNALNTIKMFERFKGKIIYTSTCSVYGNADIFPTPEVEDIRVSNAYDTSKYIAELFLKQRRNYTTLRLSNVYGIRQRPENPYCGVLGKFIQSALKNEPLKIFGDGNATRDYTYVGDVVDAIIKAIDMEALNMEINIATSVETSINVLGKLVWQTVNKVQKYSRVEPRSIDGISRRCLDISRAEKLLNWKPETSLEDGVKRTVDWQQSLVNIF